MAKINITEKDTKDTILKAYQALLKEKQNLEKEVKQLQSELQSFDNDEDNDYEEDAYSENETANIPNIIDELKNIRAAIAHAISDLSSQQVTEVTALQKINENIAKEKAEAKELYNIDLTDNTLENLFGEYENTKNSFEESFAAKKKASQESISEKQLAWQKEQEESKNKIAERNKQNELAHKREVDEFEYIKKQNRAAADDKSAQIAKQRKEELAQLKADNNTKWNEIEKALAEKEKEFETYKQKFEAAETDILKEVKKAEGEGRGIIERDHKVKLNLFNAEVSANQRTMDLKISSLQSTIKNQDEQITKLTAQLEKALTQSQALAIKALEGSSNAESFAAIREIAIEQAKNSSKAK